MHAELVVDVSRLEELRGDWDRLAVEAGAPYSAPGWLLPWLRHVAPTGAELRAVAVVDGDRLVGLAPLFADRAGRLAMLGVGTCSGVEPLAQSGAREPVAAATAQVLAASEPTPRALAFDGVLRTSDWPRLIADAWSGGGALVLLGRTERAPFAERPDGGYAAWFAARSQHFRKRMRRARRALEEEGASFRRSGAEEVERDLRSFAELHRARWADRGGSGVVTGAVERMLEDAARDLGPDRLRVWVLETNGTAVAVEILVAAGDVSTFWLGGFDPAWASSQPSLQTMLVALEHAFEAGDRRVELGEGGQDFKYRLADGDEELRWAALVPPGPGRTRARIRLRALAVRRALAARTPPAPKRLLRRAVGAVRNRV